ncbi:XRCC4-like factor-domain-containing protein [Colletotrichum navitas]|uniref:Non-homologous end-joining factor 1 n=1 Tax=Colletotrichum navitas TaxID=681940 RepID=A0AAD8PM49_9PEZI|nr:XRCC4-like factor-domain-containing protein [Colletotrichum navitas]KAK1569845.1 XRCC4-like factor-domain-containing protein [Colletotrichum navitas]
MTTPPVWRQLPVSSSTGLPNLLVSTSFSTTSYTIHLTDLANIWVESLDRKAIYKRSLNESTSIDPTDSDSNMRAFLSKIRSVFEPSHQDHAEASLSVSTIPSKEAGAGGLTLSIVCNLENTKPLEWPMYLQRCPQSQLAYELVIPLAQAHTTGRRQIDSLKDIIRQKDAIITKLLDKLEATGTRLENIFTVLSAKQKPTRKMAEDKVKGLAPFRSEDWTSQLDEHQEDMSSLFQYAFGADGLEYRRNPDAHNTASLDDWWIKLQSPSIPIVGITSSSRLNQSGMSLTSPGQLESNGSEAKDAEVPAEDDDDDFQVQSTPPHLMSTRKRFVNPPPAEDGDGTTKDRDTPPIPDSVPVLPLENNVRCSRLGTIGKRHQPMPTRTSSPPQALELEGSETETESEEDAAASLAEASSPPQRAGSMSDTKDPKGGLDFIRDKAGASKAPNSPRKGALGRIGGESARSKSPEPPKRTGLGRIGGGARPVKTPEPTAIAAQERGRSRVNTTLHKQPRETSRDRADRKRDELQKDLQRKAAAGPARKKRKF